MRIEIDTSRDSHEEIRKAIQLLMSLVSGTRAYSNAPVKNIFDSPDPSVRPSDSPAPNAFAAMFGGDAPQPEKKEEPRLEMY